MCIPAYNQKAVNTDGMSCRLAVFVNGGGGSKVFPGPVPKGPSQFPSVFFLTACLGAFESVYYPILLGGSVLVLWDHQKFVDGVMTSEMNLYS